MARRNPALVERRNKTMPKSEFALSGYRAMWLFAMFDLPMDKPELRLSTPGSGAAF